MFAARKLVFSGVMDSDYQDELILNLRQLNIGTRCANSLIHEYGHILQYRIWFNEGIDPQDYGSLYEWFFDIGYAENIADRYPGFDTIPDEDKILVLKEGFVEDYRIWLNKGYTKGYYELPNAYCFRGDFESPDFMEKGVDIVKRTLTEYNTQKANGTRGVSYEPDRVRIADEIMQNSHNFTAGHSRMSTSDHKAVIERLRKNLLHPV